MNNIAFVKPSIEELKKHIEKELKTIEYEKLAFNPLENVTIEPVYTHSSHQSIHPNVDSRINFQEIAVEGDLKNVNDTILEALENGISGIILHFTNDVQPIDFGVLLKDVRLDYIYTMFKTQQESLLHGFQEYTSQLKYTIPSIQLGSFSDSNLASVKVIEHEDYILHTSNILNQIIEISKNEIFWIELSGDYFFDIAKIRAFKILFDSLNHKLNLQIEYRIIGFTSDKNKSKENTEFNILKATTEGMAAMAAGCDGLWIKPFDSLIKQHNHFSDRISRNVFNLMKEESYLDLVQDPASGSYFIENYTEKIAKEIYKHLI